MKFKDLTGLKFGKLTIKNRVESKADSSGRKRTRWNCICDCGNDNVIVLGDYLNRSDCPSCGCETHENRVRKNRHNNIGEKYGRLTIMDILWDENPVRAVCKCDCGNDFIGRKADIASGHTQSCGCLQSEMTSISNVKDWCGYVSDSGVKFLRQHHTNNKGQWIWECRCPLCDSLFYELPAKVNNGHTTSCGCRKQSFGEQYIASLLEELCIDFKQQYIFNDCKHIYNLRFDFAIFSNNNLLGLIEYDGRQHFEPVDVFGGQEGFKKTKNRDEIKNIYCNTHGIPLLRLPYILSTHEIKEKIYEYYLSLTTAGCA
jgi:hypothetical protein